MKISFDLDFSAEETKEAFKMFGLATKADIDALSQKVEHSHTMLHQIAEGVRRIEMYVKQIAPDSAKLAELATATAAMKTSGDAVKAALEAETAPAS